MKVPELVNFRRLRRKDETLPNPLSILAGVNDGLWWNYRDPESLWQISDGTVPVTSHNDPIGRATDMLGFGNHGKNASTPGRPLFQDLAGVKNAKFDGFDDRHFTNFVANWAQPNSYGLMFQLNVADESLFDGIAGTRNWFGANGGTLAMYAGGQHNVVAADTAKHYVLLSFDGLNSYLTLDGVEYGPFNTGTQGVTGITLGSNISPGYFVNSSIYEFIGINGSFSEQQKTELNAYFAGNM